MEKMIYTADELNNAGRDELIGIILSLQENIARMTRNQELILEQITILRGQRFGRHSEKMNVIDGQMSLFFNEPEATAGEPGAQAEEPEFEEVVIHRKDLRYVAIPFNQVTNLSTELVSLILGLFVIAVGNWK